MLPVAKTWVLGPSHAKPGHDTEPRAARSYVKTFGVWYYSARRDARHGLIRSGSFRRSSTILPRRAQHDELHVAENGQPMHRRDLRQAVGDEATGVCRYAKTRQRHGAQATQAAAGADDTPGTTGAAPASPALRCA